jgi:hypothetical protein
LEEYVYFRHVREGKVVRTRTRVPCGYLPIKRVQQMLSKKNSYNLKIDSRSAKTGQLNAEGKVAKISDSENYALSVIGADSALREFFGPRSDDFGKKQQLYQRISQEGYAYLKDLTSDVEGHKTLNAADVYLLGGGLKSDLVTQGLELVRTLKGKAGARKSSAQKIERK